MKKAASAAKKNEWFSKTFAIGQLRSVRSPTVREGRFPPNALPDGRASDTRPSYSLNF
jgi:hypothetical protein